MSLWGKTKGFRLQITCGRNRIHITNAHRPKFDSANIQTHQLRNWFSLRDVHNSIFKASYTQASNSPILLPLMYDFLEILQFTDPMWAWVLFRLMFFFGLLAYELPFNQYIRLGERKHQANMSAHLCVESYYHLLSYLHLKNDIQGENWSLILSNTKWEREERDVCDQAYNTFNIICVCTNIQYLLTLSEQYIKLKCSLCVWVFTLQFSPHCLM